MFNELLKLGPNENSILRQLIISLNNNIFSVRKGYNFLPNSTYATFFYKDTEYEKIIISGLRNVKIEKTRSDNISSVMTVRRPEKWHKVYPFS